MDNIQPSDLIQSVHADLKEEHPASRSSRISSLPSLGTFIREAGPFPRESLLLGVAGDGLPVLLNLYDPIPGPILISGDTGSGKTNLLKMIARATEYMHTPGHLQYGVISSHPEEWASFMSSKTNAGIYSMTDELSLELLQSLVTWAHNNKGETQSILLLIDDLPEFMQLDEQAHRNMRWLLLRGPSRRVWPIVTLPANCSSDLKDWMDFFRTRLFGRIQDAAEAQHVTGGSNGSLPQLLPGVEFCLREDDHWLKFLAPAI